MTTQGPFTLTREITEKLTLLLRKEVAQDQQELKQVVGVAAAQEGVSAEPQGMEQIYELKKFMISKIVPRSAELNVSAI